jgi:hypothetical protein
MLVELVVNMDLQLDWQLLQVAETAAVVVVVMDHHNHNHIHNILMETFDVDDIEHVQFLLHVLVVHVNRVLDDDQVELLLHDVVSLMNDDEVVVL